MSQSSRLSKANGKNSKGTAQKDVFMDHFQNAKREPLQTHERAPLDRGGSFKTSNERKSLRDDHYAEHNEREQPIARARDVETTDHLSENSKKPLNLSSDASQVQQPSKVDDVSEVISNDMSADTKATEEGTQIEGELEIASLETQVAENTNVAVQDPNVAIPLGDDQPAVLLNPNFQLSDGENSQSDAPEPLSLDGQKLDLPILAETSQKTLSQVSGDVQPNDSSDDVSSEFKPHAQEGQNKLSHLHSQSAAKLSENISQAQNNIKGETFEQFTTLGSEKSELSEQEKAQIVEKFAQAEKSPEQKSLFPADKPTANGFGHLVQERLNSSGLQITSIQEVSAKSGVQSGASVAGSAELVSNGRIGQFSSSLPVEITAAALRGKNSFEIRMDPPELGRLRVRLEVNGAGKVKGRLIVERPEALEALTRDLPRLRDALEAAGLKTDAGSFDLSLAGGESNRGQKSFEEQNSQNSFLNSEQNHSEVQTIQMQIERRRGAVAGSLSQVDMIV